MSVSKLSGKPEALPSHSLPASADSGALMLLGPAGMGVPAGELKPPEPPVKYAAGLEKLVSMGKRDESLILPKIHLFTSWMY